MNKLDSINKALKSKIDLGAYTYSCPSDSASVEAYYQYINGKPITSCVKESYRIPGKAPVSGDAPNRKMIQR